MAAGSPRTAGKRKRKARVRIGIPDFDAKKAVEEAHRLSAKTMEALRKG